MLANFLIIINNNGKVELTATSLSPLIYSKQCVVQLVEKLTDRPVPLGPGGPKPVLEEIGTRGGKRVGLPGEGRGKRARVPGR